MNYEPRRHIDSAPGTPREGELQHHAIAQRELNDEQKLKLYGELFALSVDEFRVLHLNSYRADFDLETQVEKAERLARRKQEKHSIADRHQCTTKQLDGLGAALTKYLESFYQEFMTRAGKLETNLAYGEFLQVLLPLVENTTRQQTFRERELGFSSFEKECQLRFPDAHLGVAALRVLYGMLVEVSRDFELQRIRTGEVKITPSAVVVIPLLKVYEDERLVQGGSSAHSYNFDNPIKNEWRDRLQKFVLEAVREGKIRPELAVCLPGITSPELELSIYRDLFPSIIAAERGNGKRSLETFRYQMQRLKPEYPNVTPYEGELSDCLDMLAEKGLRVSAGAFDYHGYLCEEILRTMQRLLLQEEAILVVNVMTSREKHLLKDTWEHLENSHPHLTDGQALSKSQRAQLFRDYTFLYNLGLGREENRGPYAESVRHAQDRWKNRSGRPHRSSGKRAEVTERVGFFDWYQVNIIQLCSWIAQEGVLPPQLKTELKEGGLGVGLEDLKVLPRLVLNCSLGMPLVKDIERLGYFSRSGRSNLPFQSFFALIHTPLKEYEKLREVVDFAHKLMVNTMFTRRKGDIGYLSLTNARGAEVGRNPADSRSHVRYDDKLCLVINGKPRRECSITIDALIQGCNSYQQLESQYFLRENNGIARVERQFLNGRGSHSQRRTE
jgi:hypothetical protein